MNPEIKEKWITALTSGEYKQGKYGLKTASGTFCCLGVLCDIASKEAGIGKWEKFNHSTFFKVNGKQVSALLPHEVQIWAELDSISPRINGNGELATLNDDGMSFEEIAQLIKEKL